MLPISDDEIKRWRVELDRAKEFRTKEFGTYHEGGQQSQTTRAGKNLDYFEFGADTQRDEIRAQLNLAFVLTKNIVPILFPQNPKALSLPSRPEDSASAPIAGSLVNHYFHLLNLKEVDQQVVFDSWVLGYGISKTGYVTEFGADAPLTKEQDQKRLREKLKEKLDDQLVKLGLKKPQTNGQDEKSLVSNNEFIISESPYTRWVDPFGFLIDPRARNIFEAWWVAETIRKTLWEIKRHPRYGSAKNKLKADPLQDQQIPDTQIEKFQTAEIHEIHYKNPDSPTGITILVLGTHSEQTEALSHEHSVYAMRGWQYELLAFNKHNHRLYPVSDLSQVRPLLDQLNDTFGSVLEQVDKFVSKLAYDKNKMTPEGEHQLKAGTIGALVAVNGDPASVIRVFNFEQVKQDLITFIEKIVDLIILMTGLTRAQLTGLTTAQTATESQIGQSGANNRRLDQNMSVVDFLNRQTEKLWSVIAQFVDLEQVHLLTGETGTSYEDESGLPKYSWLPDITTEVAEQLQNGEYRFQIEMTSVQRPNLEILRKQVENLITVLANPVITQGLASEGKRLDVAEGLRIALKLYPELISDPSRIIRPLSTQPMIPQLPGANLPSIGGIPPVQEALRQTPPPNTADLASAAAGEKGQGFPLA